MFDFKTVLVTGASSGIGAAVAEITSGAGLHTVVVARRSERLAELAATNSNVEVLVGDLTVRSDLEKVCERVGSVSEPIDLLVNNAGGSQTGEFSQLTRQQVTSMINLNIVALTELSSSALAQMRARDRGWILQVSSVAGFQPGPSAAVYSATKAYVTSFTEALAEELRDTTIKVCALCPGFVATEFHLASGSPSALASVPGFAVHSARNVAMSGLEGVNAGRVVVVPGAVYKALVGAGRALPRSITRSVAGLVGRARID